jgi:hypothetical protein
MRRTAVLLTLLIAAPLAAQQQTFRLLGVLSGRGVYATGQPSWLSGGFGRLDVGAGGVREHRNELLAIAQLGAEWAPVSWFDAHVSGVARREPDAAGGRRAGLVEGYVDLRAGEFQLRAGEFFLPTSRENRDELWTSPYTITLSAWNSWIAQEVRPIGVDGEWKHLGSSAVYTLAGTAFKGNDSMGSLLAWRGWSLGNRLSVHNEVLPLPPLFSLRDPRMFGANQRGDGTLPIGRDLDGRIGWSARVRVTIPERGMIQFARVDNRGERELYRGEYAWATAFNVVSTEVGTRDTTLVAAEFGWGNTGMGFAPNARVQMKFDAGYLLVSHKLGKMRYSGRFDSFATIDRDHSIAETNTEHGRSWTLAAFYEPNEHSRTGLEFTNVTGGRVAAAESGFDPNTDARTLIAEVRYRF